MSLRALRVFDEKMRGHEAALDVALLEAVVVIPVAARPQLTARMLVALDDLRSELEWRGDLFLSQARSEGYRLLERDLAGLRGAGVNTDRVQIRPSDVGVSAMGAWRDYLRDLTAKAFMSSARLSTIATPLGS